MKEIIIEGLSKKIKGTLILDNVNMQMEPGKVYGLRGKNGCGKTMIMRALCGLLIPDSGKVIIDGEVLHRDIKFPRSVGVLIENPSFLPQYTGYENLRMLSKLMGNISDEEVRNAIERVGLDPDDGRTYRKYSLGMKQKLGIANAIMGEPVSSISTTGLWSSNVGGSRWIHQCSPFSRLSFPSNVSPSTLNSRPNVCSPTGT